MKNFSLFLILLSFNFCNAQKTVFNRDTVINTNYLTSIAGKRNLLNFNDSLLLYYQQDEYANRSIKIKTSGLIDILFYNKRSKTTFQKQLRIGLQLLESYSLDEDYLLSSNDTLCLYMSGYLFFFRYSQDSILKYFDKVDFRGSLHKTGKHSPSLRGIINGTVYYTIFNSDKMYAYSISLKSFLNTNIQCPGNSLREYAHFKNIAFKKNTIAIADPFEMKVRLYRNDKLIGDFFVDSLLKDSNGSNLSPSQVDFYYKNKSHIANVGFLTDDLVYANCVIRNPGKSVTQYTFIIKISKSKGRVISCNEDYMYNPKRKLQAYCKEQPIYFYPCVTERNRLYMACPYVVENSCTKTWDESFKNRIIDRLAIEEYEMVFKH